MPAPYHVSIFYQTDGGYGWSESAWYNGSIAFADLVNVMNARFAVRGQFLANDCTAQYARVSTNVARDPIVLTLFNAVAGNRGSHPNKTSEDFLAILFEESNNVFGYNRTFLRGIPSGQVVADQIQPDAAFINGVNRYAQYLAGPQTPWVVRTTLSNPKQFFPITAVTPTKPRGFTFQCAQLTLNVGDTVEINRATELGYTGRKGITQVDNPGPAAVYHCGGATPAHAEPAGTAIRAAQVIYSSGPIQQGVMIRATRRSPGRPFGQRRGRRQTLFSLRQ